MKTKKQIKKKVKDNLTKGKDIINEHELFFYLVGDFVDSNKEKLGKHTAAIVDRNNNIWLNRDFNYEPKEWAFVIAHCLLHIAFGHFDAERMPGYYIEKPDGTKEWKIDADNKVWNLACDIYITKFLKDIKLGKCFTKADPVEMGAGLGDERKIYDYLIEKGITGEIQEFGTAPINSMDMRGLDKPVYYKDGESNWAMEVFAESLADSAADAVSLSGGHGVIDKGSQTKAEKALNWFINHYPLLGNLAAMFKLVESSRVCIREEISIAAIDINDRKLYINPSALLSYEEMKFVIAHELLHAGLDHQGRCQGRDHYLWNVSCDFVINGWLNDMNVGKMPEQGLLYDETYKNWSAESIYDEIIKEFKKNKKLKTFRGYDKGDIIDNGNGSKGCGADAVSLDEFCKSALAQGVEYHIANKRGCLPEGLIEEVRAISMPVIPWDVELARWFDCNFPPVEKHYTYSRPSRRQGATPDIPRPSYSKVAFDETSRTFGVIIDTSGSMTNRLLGKALGSIASYAEAKDVSFVRVIFCDAKAYDAGYLSPEEIAGRVEVKGRGGTKLQPSLDMLEDAKDFPNHAPVLIITDGYIESHLNVHKKHAYLIPKGNRLPFKAKGEVFYFA